jgi:hypothetical protein
MDYRAARRQKSRGSEESLVGRWEMMKFLFTPGPELDGEGSYSRNNPRSCSS